jgi:hypothetical protein
MRKQKIGETPAHRIPIVSKSGDVVGNVGPKATTATVARFLGHHNARLGVHGGRKSWIESGTNSRPRATSAVRPKALLASTHGEVSARRGTEVAATSK